MLIKNAKIVKEDGEEVVDLLISGDKIERIAPAIEADEADMIDIDGAYLLPSIIDLNISLKDRVFKLEYLNRLKRKALHAGVTTFVLMPNFKPKLSSDGLVELLSTKIDEDEIILAIDGVDKESGKLEEIAKRFSDGVKVIETDSDIDGNALKRIFEYSIMLNMPIFIKAKNRSMDASGVMNEGEISFALGLAGISKLSEVVEVSKILPFLEFYDTTLLFHSLTTQSALEKVKAYQDSGYKAYSEVSISHLIFSDEKCQDYNTLAKVLPPLRDKKERKALVLALKEGLIDTITSMQSAVSYSKKDVAFNDALDGVNILEHHLSLCYTYLVKSGEITLYELTKLLSKNPAKILNLPKRGEIKEGYIADMLIFDPNPHVKVQHKSILAGLELNGQIKGVIKEGRLVK